MASYKEATGKSIEEAFREFHKANPKIYELFKEQVLRAQKAGKKKVSSKAIINYIRWEMHVKTTSEDGYKINDAFTAMYSRKYITDFPHNKDLFEFRHRKAMDLGGVVGPTNTDNIKSCLDITVPRDSKTGKSIERGLDSLKTFNKARQENFDFK